MFNIFKRKSNNSKEAFKKIKSKVPVSQERVLRAIQNIQPCHYRQISAHLKIIEGCVTPRIAELRRKGLVKVAYVNKGISSPKVNYYQVTGKGMKRLIEIMGENV